MRNVEFEVKGSALTIRVDLSKRLGLSKSGKTTIIGSTDGIVEVASNEKEVLKVGLNVFTGRQSASGF